MIWKKATFDDVTVPAGESLCAAPRRRLMRAFAFTVKRGKIAQVEIMADRARLRELDLAVQAF